MSNAIVNRHVVQELEGLRASVDSMKAGANANMKMAEGIESLKASVGSIKDGLSGTKRSEFMDKLHEVLDFFAANHVDGLRHYLDRLAAAVTENDPNNAEALRVQVNSILPHIQQVFRGLAVDITSSLQNAASGHNEALNDLERQTKDMKLVNFQLSLALQNVKHLGDIKDTLQAPAPAREGVSPEQYLELHDKSNAQKAEIRELQAKLADAVTPKLVSSEVQMEALCHLEEENLKLKAALAESESRKASDVTDNAAELVRKVEELEEANRAQEDTLRDQRGQIQQHDDKCRALLARYKDMVEQVADLKGNIRIMCRIRPAEGTPEEDLVQFTNPDKNSMMWSKLRATYLDGSSRSESREYDFQRAFGTGESNQEVFDEVKDFAQSAALGKSCTIMAYGATGTGKSHTFLSSDGLVHNYISLMFQLAREEAGQFEYSMVMSAVEIYLNNVYDLLQTSNNGQKVEIKLTQESYLPLNSRDEAFQTIKKAIDRREAASTRQNETSSRSHFIISVKIVRRSVADGKTTEGTTSFVDLAGSESVGKNLPSGSLTAQQKQQLTEGNDINSSLLNLGLNIKQLAGKVDGFSPTHNLTRFLKTSLGKGSRLLVIVTVSPLVTNQSNTLASLRWSMEAVGGKTTRLAASRTSDVPPSPSRSSRISTAAPATGRSSSLARTPLGGTSSVRSRPSTSSLSTQITVPEAEQSPTSALAERRERRERRQRERMANSESRGSR